MLSRADLLFRTPVSHPHGPPARSLLSGLPHGRFPYRTWIKGLLGASLPLGLLSASLPVAAPVDHARIAPAAAFALASSVGAFLGDAAIADAAADELAALDGVEGTLGFGAPVAKPAVAIVSADIANLRGGPGLSYDKIGKLKLGTSVTLLGRSSDWFRVQTSAGAMGWVAQEVLDVDAGIAAGIALVKDIPVRPASLQATTTDTGVNVRQGPGASYPSLGKLGRGVTLDLIGRQAGWFKVQSAAGMVGWVTADFLAMADGVAARVPVASETQAAASGSVATVSEARTNLRRGPGTDYDLVARLSAGDRVTLVARHDDWFRIQTANGTTGWVSGDLIDAAPAAVRGLRTTNDFPAAPQPQPATTRASSDESFGATSRGFAVARVAMRYVGSRYVWGGASPRGFDCSGLVLYAYRHVGIPLPHKASGMFSRRYGARIHSIGALHAGDIVFFANTAGPGITHVALFVGNGRIVTATSRRTGVQLQSLVDNRYWRSHFAGAIRPQ